MKRVNNNMTPQRFAATNSKDHFSQNVTIDDTIQWDLYDGSGFKDCLFISDIDRFVNNTQYTAYILATLPTCRPCTKLKYYIDQKYWTCCLPEDFLIVSMKLYTSNDHHLLKDVKKIPHLIEIESGEIKEQIVGQKAIMKYFNKKQI
jgi:hypothetical protein